MDLISNSQLCGLLLLSASKQHRLAAARQDPLALLTDHRTVATTAAADATQLLLLLLLGATRQLHNLQRHAASAAHAAAQFTQGHLELLSNLQCKARQLPCQSTARVGLQAAVCDICPSCCC
jgi:hypothetical protein